MRRFMNRAMPPRAARRALAWALSAAALGAAGCLMQASYSANVTTADGVQIEVPLSREAVVVEDDAVSVKNFRFTPLAMEGGKGLAFGFELEFRQGARPVAISVEDVSDLPILGVYSDNAPAFAKKDIWRAISPPHSAADPLVGWLMTLDNTVKVYRFTVKLSDGTTHVLRYPIVAPAQMKAIMRTNLGFG